MKDRADIKEAKARLSVTALLDLRAPNWRNINPIRADDQKNSFGANGLGWTDHGAGDKGDQITFLEKSEGLRRGDAVNRFLELAGMRTSRTNGHPPKPPNVDWPARMAAFNDTKAEELANNRGYLLPFVHGLKGQHLIGIYPDDFGNNQFALPVHDDCGAVDGMHHKHTDGMWRTSPLVVLMA